MRWPWVRDTPEPDNPKSLRDARRARETAEHRLREAHDQHGEVERLADALRRIRQRNHLVEILEDSIRARREERGDHA